MANATHRGDPEGWPAKEEAVRFPGASVLNLSQDGLIIGPVECVHDRDRSVRDHVQPTAEYGGCVAVKVL
jgi:hypothetical protein